MKLKKYDIKACCGKTSIIYTIDRPIDRAFIDKLINIGFIEQTNFTSSGILYAYNKIFILSGEIGKPNLQVKSKISNFEQSLNDLEKLLENF